MKVKKERRAFLQQCWRLTLQVPLANLGLAGCGHMKKGHTSNQKLSKLKSDPCGDLAGVPSVDIEKRKSLGYTPVSPIPDKHCGNCQLFVPPKAGAECGGCLLFAGPVSPEGYCTYWAPVV